MNLNFSVTLLWGMNTGEETKGLPKISVYTKVLIIILDGKGGWGNGVQAEGWLETLGHIVHLPGPGVCRTGEVYHDIAPLLPH